MRLPSDAASFGAADGSENMPAFAANAQRAHDRYRSAVTSACATARPRLLRGDLLRAVVAELAASITIFLKPATFVDRRSRECTAMTQLLVVDTIGRTTPPPVKL